MNTQEEKGVDSHNEREVFISTLQKAGIVVTGREWSYTGRQIGR
jgi:hypothetical protein